MKYIIRSGPADNTGALEPWPRFDGSQANTSRVTRLLAVLASVAGDHTQDKLARQMLRNAAGELFDAAARMERVAQCGAAERSPSVMEGAHAIA